MALALVTAPAAEPVTLAEAKTAARIDHDALDATIEGFIIAAREIVEQASRRQLMQATWRLSLDRWPYGREILLPSAREIRIPVPPLVSVLGLTYVDGNGDTKTFATTNYLVDADSEPARISLVWNAVWPLTRLQANAIQITFVAGHGGKDATVAGDDEAPAIAAKLTAQRAAVPQTLKLAMKLLVAHWLRNPEAAAEAEQKEIPFGFAALIGAGGYGSYCQ